MGSCTKDHLTLAIRDLGQVISHCLQVGYGSNRRHPFSETAVLLIEVYQQRAKSYNAPYTFAGCQSPLYAKHQTSALHCIICLR